MWEFLRKLLHQNPIGLAAWRALQFPYPLRVALIELILTALPRVRPHYYSALFEAATSAKRLGYPAISAIEFGVAGGAGLLALERYAAKVSNSVGIGIEVYGFDRAEGLPPARDYRDMPFAWKPGYFRCDPEALRQKLKHAKLVVGDIGSTLADFLEKRPAPIGCIFVDVDYYSSTLECLSLFDRDGERYLPRVICYFDDLGNGIRYLGEHAAIRDFNRMHSTKKIARRNSFYDSFVYGRRSSLIFEMHDFEHPRYAGYTGFAAHTVDVETTPT